MNANNTQPQKYVYSAIKFNKQDTIYQLENLNNQNELITEFVKIEKFQGYSKAYNLGLYFRIKNQSSWKKSKQITGLWKTTRLDYYRGNIREVNGKTLLVFKIDTESQKLTVFLYPKLYNPNSTTIDKLVNLI